MADDLDLEELDLEAELAAMQQEEAEKEQAKEQEQAKKEQEKQQQEPEEGDEDPPAASDPEGAAPGSRAPSAAEGTSRPTSSRSSRPGTSAKVHPAPEPPPPLSEHDPEKGAVPEEQLDDETPDWAHKWLSGHNKAAKLNAFQQYIQRVQDQGEGPVECPTAEQRHATARWVTSRFLLDRFSAHGVPHIVRHQGRCRRLFWALVVLVALAALVFQVYATLAEYFAYPKKVTIEVLEEKEPEFPAVTICNFNILGSDKMKEVDEYKEIVLLEEELRNHQLDCDAYKKDFDGFYSTNDDYDLYDYMWIDDEDGVGMEDEDSVGKGLQETIEPTTEGTGRTDDRDGTDSTDGVEPTFYEVSTKPGARRGGGDQTDSTDSPDSTDSTAEDGEEATTEPANGEKDARRKREARIIGSKRTALKNDNGKLPHDVGDGTSGAAGRHSRMSGGRREPQGPGPRLGGRRLQSAQDPAGDGASPRTGRRRRLVRRRRRSADWPDELSPNEGVADWYNTLTSVDVPDNYTHTFFDPTCKCEMTCDRHGCFQSDSIFNTLGQEKTFRNLLQSLRGTAADPAMMQRAFTPSAEDMQKYGIKGAQFITACSLDGSQCSHDDFLPWQSDGYGNCFTFNSGFRYTVVNNEWVHIKPNKTRTYGSKSGLRVTLNVDAAHYASLLTPDVGVRVLVHPTDQLPFPEERGFSVVPGLTTAVGISRKRIRRIGKPHGHCRNYTDWSEHIDIRYTATVCRKRCIEEAIRSTCGCIESVNRALTIGLARNLPRCNPLVDAAADQCRQQVKFRFASGADTCDCPPACLEDRFEKSLSMNLPNKIYYKIMQNFTHGFTGADLCDTSDISNSTIRLQVFLEDLSYEYIHESAAYSVEALISNIGGVMGLCLGLSALTLVELVEYLLELLVNGWRNCCNRKDRAATRSGIRKVEVLPADQKTGMQYVRVVHKFDVPRETVLREWTPPTLVDAQTSTMVTVPVSTADNRWIKTK